MRNLFLAVLLSLAAQCAGAAPINLVQNGDFELAVTGPGDVPGWTYSGGDSYFGVDLDYIGSPASRPGQVFYDGAASSIGYLSQLIATVTGVSYRLEFDLQRYDNSGLAADNLAIITFGGVTVFSETDIASDWTHFIVDGLVGGAGSATLLQFANLNAVDFNQLDNITLIALNGPVPVPEPSTSLALAAAAGAMILTRRRRRA